MSEIETKILDLLNKGWSYSQIQDELQVSSKTIAAARKAHFPITESNTGALSGDTFQLQPNPPPVISESPYKPKQLYRTIQKIKKMSTENEYFEDDDEISSQLELEKYRLKLAHELQLEKLQASKEDKEREHDLKEQELSIKRDELAKEQRKVADEKRDLLYRIKKVIDSCEDGEYSYEEADNLLEEARKVLSESEKYCFMNEITFQGSVSHTLLSKVIATLTDFLDGMDEDDSDDLEFDSAFRKQVSHATFQNF
jgi:hypothetical protein